MNGIKTDIVFSCHHPVLCDACRVAAGGEQVSNEFLDIFQKEIGRIRKKLYYRAAEGVKRHPLLALGISSVFAVALGIIGSVIAAYLYEGIRRPDQSAQATPAAVTPAASQLAHQP